MPLGGRGRSTPNGKNHLKLPFWLFDTFPYYLLMITLLNIHLSVHYANSRIYVCLLMKSGLNNLNHSQKRETETDWAENGTFTFHLKQCALQANIVRIALTFGLTVATLAASIGKSSFSDRSNVHIYFLSHPYWHIHWTSIGPIISGLFCPSMTDWFLHWHYLI